MLTVKNLTVLLLCIRVAYSQQLTPEEIHKKNVLRADSLAFALSSKGKLDSIKSAKYDFDDGMAVAETQPERAINYFTNVIKLCDDDNNEMVLETYAMRALCRTMIHDYALALRDADKVILLSSQPIHLVLYAPWRLRETIDESVKIAYSARGIAHYSLGNTNEACDDWREAIKKGDKSSNEYIDKYCR